MVDFLELGTDFSSDFLCSARVQCPCTVQHGRLPIRRYVGRFSAGLLAHVTTLSHPHLKMEALEGLQQFVAITVNFGQSQKVKMLDPSGCFPCTKS